MTETECNAMKKLLRISALLLMLSLLSGCSSRVDALPKDSATLPPAAVSFTAPIGQMDASRSAVVQLFLPSLDNTRLVAVNRRAALDPYRWHADTLVDMLFAYEGDEANSLPRAEYLERLGPVEISCGIATVNLSAQALNLSHEQLYIVFQAITNTLCRCDEINSVNLLIAGMQPGLDVASQTPTGALHLNTTDDLSALWSRALSQRNAADGTQRLVQDVSLFFPAAGGKGVLCENRTLAFSAVTLPHMARTLLDALSEGPKALSHLPACPPLHAYLTSEPAVNELSGEKVLTLRFTEALNGALLDAGIPRSCMAASLVLTMTTYLPGIAGVEIYIGDEKLQSLTPEGTYQGAGNTIYFTNGVMRRSQFSIFLLSEAALYFARDNTLAPVYRAVPWYEAPNAHYLLTQLILGPAFYDAGSASLSPVMPQGAAQGDILGTAYADDGTALINLTARFRDIASGMTVQQERLCIYAMVNTLTELENIREVCIFVDGSQPDTFVSAISLPGTFLRNVDIIAR